MRIRRSAGLSTGASASTKFCAFTPSTTSLCRIRNRSCPPITACSAEYSTPSRRGSSTRNSPSGSSDSSTQPSVVILDPTQIIRYFSERVAPMLTQ
ncbi:Uncharacterised protein [Mycobacteroides abscessus subsp. abscessus]|nr:Uncharacterised protein [Mycobacteroides abscessus subsp. abscessus]